MARGCGKDFINNYHIVIIMTELSLIEFILMAHKHTYAAPKEVKKKYRCENPILPGHKDYDFVYGDWRYHDSYAGTKWAPGREVVFYKGEPVWCMSYQGQTVPGLAEDFIEETFEFLKKALRTITVDLPFRGPSRFEEGDFVYTFEIKGDLKYFTGREAITYRGKEVFFQDVMGEMIF
jgi:hypothetical protein